MRSQRAAKEHWKSVNLKKSMRVVKGWNTLKRDIEAIWLEIPTGGARGRLFKDLVWLLADCQLGSNGVPDLHQCWTPDVPWSLWDLADKWDELTGKVLDQEKVVKGRLFFDEEHSTNSRPEETMLFQF